MDKWLPKFWKVMLSVAAFTFVAFSGLSYVFLSDGYGLSKVNDGVKCIGAPLAFWKAGGIAYREDFFPNRLALDIGFALAVGFFCARQSTVRQRPG